VVDGFQIPNPALQDVAPPMVVRAARWYGT
jgi:hypothetical protein